VSGFDPRPIGKAARSERRKLLATTLNAIGLTVLGLGAITPMVTGGRIAPGSLTSAGASLYSFWRCSPRVAS
jgi:hypothetical protein